MKHIEKAESKHLDKIISEIREGKFVIPDFQREFEWDPWDVNSLITSIFMDYYIGTLLLWKASPNNIKVLSCEPIKGFEGTTRPEHIVLDGQQRLTAMYFAFFNPDIPYPKRKKRCYFFMDINQLNNENYEEAFYYKWESIAIRKLAASQEMQFRENIFPMEVVGRGSWEIISWVNAYKSFWMEQKKMFLEGENKDSVIEDERRDYTAEILEARRNIENAEGLEKIIKELLNDYNLSYIELDREISVGKVCDIFTHINSKGVPLSIFDLLNAILRPHEIYLKEMWRDVADDLDYTGSDKMKIYVVQVMSILEQTYCSSKYLYYLVPEAEKTIKHSDGTKEKKVLINSKEEFKVKWDSSVKAIEKSIKKLKNPREFGAISPVFVPYPSIIPAFTAINKYVESRGYKNNLDVNAKIKKWYWASIFTQSYSSSVESTTAKDFTDLKKWFEDDTLEPENYVRFVKEFEAQEFLKLTKGGAIYNAIFNVLILNEARDWYTADLPEYDTLDDHHIVPHSWGKKNNIGNINSILNRTPLSPETNRFILKDRLPNEYLKEMRDNNSEDDFYKILQSHLISRAACEILMRDPFTEEDFMEFLKERESTIKASIKHKIIDDAMELPPQLKKLNDDIENVELELRDLIAERINGKDYKEIVPPDVLDKVNRRIQTALRKDPSLSPEDFNSTRPKLEYFDLQEYNTLITSKTCWPLFEDKFKNKQQLMSRFSQLGELRNSIRHSRNVNQVATLDGQAAIVWFKNLLN
ncbi:GmrSD restriction endonuclease domain-containing protein [Salegentibacter sp. F14]